MSCVICLCVENPVKLLCISPSQSYTETSFRDCLPPFNTLPHFLLRSLLLSPLTSPLSTLQLQSSSNPDPAFDQMMTKPPRDPADKPKDLPLDKANTVGREATEDGVVVITAGATGGTPAPASAATNTSKPGSPAAPSPSPSAPDQKRAGLDVTSQGVQTTSTSTFSGPKHEEKEEKKEAVQE